MRFWLDVEFLAEDNVLSNREGLAPWPSLCRYRCDPQSLRFWWVSSLGSLSTSPGVLRHRGRCGWWGLCVRELVPPRLLTPRHSRPQPWGLSPVTPPRLLTPSRPQPWGFSPVTPPRLLTPRHSRPQPWELSPVTPFTVSSTSQLSL